MLLSSSQKQNDFGKQQEMYSLNDLSLNVAKNPFVFKDSFKNKLKAILIFFGAVLLLLILSQTYSSKVNKNINKSHQPEVYLYEQTLRRNARKLATDEAQLIKVKDAEGQKSGNGKQTLTEKASSGKKNQINYAQSSETSTESGLLNRHNSILINVSYDEKDYLPLPVDYMRKDKHGKGIADVLYKTDNIRQKREEYHKQRISFIDKYPKYSQLYLAKYNLALDEQSTIAGETFNKYEWQRLNDKLNFQDIKSQLPMCIVAVGYNNNAKFRIQYNLNSIFTQNYTNYKVVIIDDASNDGSSDIYRRYFAFHCIDKKYYTYIQNQKRVTALQNIYFGSLHFCSKDSIVVTLDADDEFIGRNTLQMFNWGYQTKKSGVLYTNFLWYQQGLDVLAGFTQQYSIEEKLNNQYRSAPMKFSQLRSYRNELLSQVDIKALQDENGDFFSMTYDQALFFPLMQLSCGRVNKIDGQYPYLYNTGTGLNDYANRKQQIDAEMKIRAKKKHQCYRSFDNKMSTS